MHRLTLAWLFAQEGWGTKVLQRFPAQGSGGQERARRPPLLGDSVPSREEGCGLEGERGGFPPTGPPRRKMKATSSQLHLDDSCRAPVTGGGEPTVPSQESALRTGGCTGNEADGCRLLHRDAGSLLPQAEQPLQPRSTPVARAPSHR